MAGGGGGGATDGCLNRVEDGQGFDVCHSADGDGVAEILDFVVGGGEGGLYGKAGGVWIAALCKVGPVGGNFFGDFAIGGAPLPGGLLEVIEDIPEFGIVAGAPSVVDGAGGKRRLLAEKEIVDGTFSGWGLQGRPAPPCPAQRGGWRALAVVV